MMIIIVSLSAEVPASATCVSHSRPNPMLAIITTSYRPWPHELPLVTILDTLIPYATDLESHVNFYSQTDDG